MPFLGKWLFFSSTFGKFRKLCYIVYDKTNKFSVAMLFSLALTFDFCILLIKVNSGPSRVSSRVLREKIRKRAILKESTANLYIVRKLNKCRFRKKYELPVFLISQKKIAEMTGKMTMRHSIKQMN